MARDFADLTQLFRQSLIQRFGLTGDGPETARLYFALGTPLPDDAFRTADGSAYFPLRAMEFMSHHCNVAPRLVGDGFFPTINLVDELYGLLLQGSSPATAADIDLLGAVKIGAKAAFDTTLISTIPPGLDTFRPTHSVPDSWFDQTRSDNWSPMQIKEAPLNRMPNLIGMPAEPVISLLSCVSLEDVDHCISFLGGQLNPIAGDARRLGKFFFEVTRSGARPDVRGNASETGSVVKNQVPSAGVDVAPGSTFMIEVAAPPPSPFQPGPIFNDGLTSPFHQMFRPIDPRLVDVLAEPVSVDTVRRLKVGAHLSFNDLQVENAALDTMFVDSNLLTNAVVAVTEELAPVIVRPVEPPRLPLALERAMDVDAGLARSARSRVRPEDLLVDDQVFSDFPIAIRADAIAFTDGVQITSQSFELEAEVCFVSFRRPWLSSAFLQLRNWYVQSFERGRLAQGNAQDGSPLAAIPIGCVLIRNLKISADWTAIDQAQSLASSHMGPFALLGRTFTAATLEVKGMQSVAWVCEPMPALPPQPTPVG